MRWTQSVGVRPCMGMCCPSPGIWYDADDTGIPKTYCDRCRSIADRNVVVALPHELRALADRLGPVDAAIVRSAAAELELSRKS